MEIAADKAAADISLMPLLGANVVADEISVDGAVVNIGTRESSL